MIRWSVAAVAAGVLVLPACTGSGSGSSTDAAPASSAGVQSAASGEVAGNYVDNKGRCTSYWNYDTTANVQLLNKMQRVGVTPEWTLAGSQSDNVEVRLKQDRKDWPSGGASGLSDEGEWDCKAVPWTISNDRSRVYAYDGGEWTGPGDSDFYWGHTQDVSGAAEEPYGSVTWSCSGSTISSSSTKPCPERALQSEVRVTWDAENDDWTKLERAAPCEFSSNSAVGCWETSGPGGQYEGQFVFNATAWTAPMRVQVTTSAKDDQDNRIVWRIAQANTDAVIWANSTSSPLDQLVKPGDGLAVGGYATASNGKHAITLILKPAYSVDAENNPLKCTKQTTGKKSTYQCVKAESVADATLPVLAKTITATVAVSLTMANVSTTSGPPSVTLSDAKDLCSVVPAASENTFSIDCKTQGAPFTFGGAWSANIKTS